jgi:hypothetical protein
MAEPVEARHRPATRPTRSKVGGLALFLCAAMLAAGSVYWAVHAYHTPRYTGGGRQLDFEIIGGLILLAGAAWNTGRKLRAPSAQYLLAHDARRPVIYLRPFDEDTRRLENYPVGNRIGGRALLQSSKLATRETYLARGLKRIGPFVAVGTPGDRLAPLGAARLYLADDDWQREVEALVKNASAIVLVPETTEGTRWEVTKVVRWVNPRRVLIVVPNPAVRPLGYARIQALTAQMLPVALPRDCAAADAFMFDAQGRPRPILFSRLDTTAFHAFVEQVAQLSEAA